MKTAQYAAVTMPRTQHNRLSVFALWVRAHVAKGILREALQTAGDPIHYPCATVLAH